MMASRAIRALTFNVRYDEPADGPNAWPHRRDLAIETILALVPDVIGLQEPTESQWNEIAAALGGYAPFGLFRDEWGIVEPRGGFFRRERFEELDSAIFWLSDTPTVPHSISWANDFGPRSCAWTRLRDRAAGRDVVFASTHFDTNAASWLPSAEVLSRELDRVADSAPIVVAGDFNCPAGSEAHRFLIDAAGFRDSWYAAGHADEDVVTYHGFTGTRRLSPAFPPEALRHGNYRVDWILIRGLACNAADIDCRRAGHLFPSDHYPVVAVVR
jgi:endonuclease/exonuclease/phosphatase family metal-dependent hydrolase